MSTGLLIALERQRHIERRGGPNDFPFQHKLCHDFESLIWVIIYAMMIRRKGTLVLTDSNAHADLKEHLDNYWGVHSYSKLVDCHAALIGTGSFPSRITVDDLLFSDGLEAEFFRAAMRLVRSQAYDSEPITYEKMQGLFRIYIEKAEHAKISTLAAA
jgi:hypothetical protein